MPLGPGGMILGSLGGGALGARMAHGKNRTKKQQKAYEARKKKYGD